jgi:single-stranded-DNA-specific exonuclease
MPKIIKTRVFQTQLAQQLADAGVHPLLARLLAARGVESQEGMDSALKHLIHPNQLLHNDDMAQRLADCIGQQRKILVVGDYLRSLNFYYLNK